MYNYSLDFTEALGGIFGNETLHSIDYQLSQAKNPEKIIERYYSMSRGYFSRLGYSLKRIDVLSKQLKEELGEYNERRKEVFNIYKEYINICLNWRGMIWYFLVLY